MTTVHPLQSPNSSGVNAPHGLGSDHTAEHCGIGAACVKIRSARRTMGRDLGGSQKRIRRMTAALSRIRDVAFLFGGCPTHGLIAPAWLRFCGLMPCGHPSGWPSPDTRSANPHGVALLLAEGAAFDNPYQERTMSSTLNAPGRANPLPAASPDFIAPAVAERSPLASLLKAFTSNEPDALNNAFEDLQNTLLQLSDALDVDAEALTLLDEYGDAAGSPAGINADERTIARSIRLKSDLIAIIGNGVNRLQSAR